jgi:hypothetical protein
VTIEELVLGVAITQGERLLLECQALDHDGDGAATTGDLVAAVVSGLHGCGNAPGP